MLKRISDQIDAKSPNRVILVFVLCWMLLNLLQSFFTELAHDEAYYWMYSKYLSWGYFDHPPVIAILIKAGYFIFQNELGVRFFIVIMGTATLYFIYKLTPNASQSTSLFIMIILSVIIIQSHAIGFLAIPDLPIVFFAVLFLHLLKKYLQKDNYVLAALIGLVVVAMLYSKYHGVLVLFFSLLPNFQLLKRKSFWLIPILAVGGMLPHLFWQINNNFPTFEYHLVSRSMPYSILHTLNYIGSQYLLAGPLIAVILFYHAIKRKATDKFELVLKFNFIGFFVFFLLATFKGRVEAHWPTIGFIPLFILSFQGIINSPKAVKWIRVCFIPGFLASLFFRLAVIIPIFPAESGIFREFHNWDVWAKEIKELAEDRTVVFANTFQRPAKYSFYNNGEFAHSVNNVFYRKNQYDVWPFEDSVRGEKVIYLADMVGKKEHCSVVGECYRYDFFDDFISYTKLSTKTDISEIESSPGDSVEIQVELSNNSDIDFNFITTDSIQSNLVAVFVKPHYYKKPQVLHPINYPTLKKGEVKEYSAKIKVPAQEGKFYCYIGVTHEQMSPPFNGRPIVVIVE